MKLSSPSPATALIAFTFYALCAHTSVAPAAKVASRLNGKTRRGHDRLYWEWARNRAVRAGKWKLCWDRAIGKWELYDLASDRTETDDLAKKFPNRVKNMSNDWIAWAKETGLNPMKRKRK